MGGINRAQRARGVWGLGPHKMKSNEQEKVREN